MGGAERVAVTLATEWSEGGHDCTIMPTYSGGGSGSFFSAPREVSVVYLASLVTHVSALSRLKALRKFVEKNKFDVVISFITNVNVAALIALLGKKLSVVVSERSDTFVNPIPFYWKVCRALTYPLAEHVVIQTEELLEKYRRSLSTYRHKLVVIPNPVSQRFARISEQATRANRLIVLGRLSSEKQIDHIIEAFAKIQPAEPWTMHIYGDGPARDVLEQMIQRLGLNESVFLHGAMVNVESVLQKGDVYCHAAKFEGFPNALVEAMAAGCAAVSYASPCGPTEILEGGRYGLLVSRDNKHQLSRSIQKLIEDDSLRERLACEGRQSVLRRFNLQRVIGMWSNVLPREK